MVRIFLIGFMVMNMAACATNDITGRSQFIMFPADKDGALGLSALTEIRRNTPFVERGPQIDRIRRIGHAIAAVSDRPDLDWEFLLIDEPTLNAWALPGGKIAVYARMANALNDLELAAVLGHEVAHTVLRHGAESLSRAQLQDLLVIGASVAVATQVDDPQTAVLVTNLAALALDGFVAMPHSRFMELEADDIGTLYMARAGFDPRAATALWRKMARLKNGAGTNLPFLSTHPADLKRIRRIESKMADYMNVYWGAGGHRGPYRFDRYNDDVWDDREDWDDRDDEDQERDDPDD